jgi:hypothetical protein
MPNPHYAHGGQNPSRHCPVAASRPGGSMAGTYWPLARLWASWEVWRDTLLRGGDCGGWDRFGTLWGVGLMGTALSGASDAKTIGCLRPAWSRICTSSRPAQKKTAARSTATSPPRRSRLYRRCGLCCRNPARPLRRRAVAGPGVFGMGSDGAQPAGRGLTSRDSRRVDYAHHGRERKWAARLMQTARPCGARGEA